jgi:hypothetical protein
MLTSGTDGSNPAPSSSESDANLIREVVGLGRGIKHGDRIGAKTPDVCRVAPGRVHRHLQPEESGANLTSSWRLARLVWEALTTGGFGGFDAWLADPRSGTRRAWFAAPLPKGPAAAGFPLPYALQQIPGS